MLRKEHFFVFVLLLLFCVNKSLAIDCYQCVGTDPKEPFQCNEWLDSDIDIQPEPCDNVYGASYCVKHIGRFEGGIGAKRFCSSLDLGNYCNYVKQPGDILTYRTCVFTCTGDGCNPGQVAKATYSSLLIPLSIVFGLYKILTVR